MTAAFLAAALLCYALAILLDRSIQRREPTPTEHVLFTAMVLGALGCTVLAVATLVFERI